MTGIPATKPTCDLLSVTPATPLPACCWLPQCVAECPVGASEGVTLHTHPASSFVSFLKIPLSSTLQPVSFQALPSRSALCHGRESYILCHGSLLFSTEGMDRRSVPAPLVRGLCCLHEATVQLLPFPVFTRLPSSSLYKPLWIAPCSCRNPTERRGMAVAAPAGVRVSAVHPTRVLCPAVLGLRGHLRPSRLVGLIGSGP